MKCSCCKEEYNHNDYIIEGYESVSVCPYCETRNMRVEDN